MTFMRPDRDLVQCAVIFALGVVRTIVHRAADTLV